MKAIDFPMLHDLVQPPLPLVLFGDVAGVVANDRFADVYLPGQLESPELHRLAHGLDRAWQPVALRRRDGRDLVACARAIAVADGVLLVFEEADGPTLIRENERLRERVTELENVSATDPLTGAWNRAELGRMVEVETSRSMRSGLPVALILLDIDHFKRVNDGHGHLAGDAVLKEFVGRIRERMRDTDSLFRWGGEEFVVLATSVGYRGGAALAEGLRRMIAAVPFANVGAITVSLGVTEHLDGESAEQWFQRTDQALYAAKRAGRNRMHVDSAGSSDVRARREEYGSLRLCWLDAYGCGEPAVGEEDRELFDLGNALIAAAAEQCSVPGAWRAALDAMLAHLVRHFQCEEALQAECADVRLAEHRRAHAALLGRAADVKAAVERGEETIWHLVDFVVRDVIALHLLKIDQQFFLDLQGESGSGGVGTVSSSGTAMGRLLH